MDSGTAGYIRAISPVGDEFVADTFANPGQHLYELPGGAEIGDAATDDFLANDPTVSFSPDGTYILGLNNSDGHFYTFDTATDITAALPGCSSSIPQWRSDTSLVCAGPDTPSDAAGDGVDSSVLLVDVASGTVTDIYDVVGALAGATPMTGDDDSPIFWDVEDSSGARQLWGTAPNGTDPHPIGAEGTAGLLSVSPDGSHLLQTTTGSVSDPEEILDLSTGTATVLPSDQTFGYAGGVYGVMMPWSPDSQYVIMDGTSMKDLEIDNLAGEVVYTVNPPAGSDSGFSYGGDAVAWTDPSCTSDNDVADGDWDFGGCFFQPDATDYSGRQDATLDGLVLSPQGGDKIDFSDGGGTGDDVSDSGPVDLEFDTSNIDAQMPAAGTSRGFAIRAVAARSAVLAAQHRALVASLKSLQWSLTGAAVSVTPDSSATIAGLPLTGLVQLTPTSGGTVTATATTALPGVLGAGSATMQVTSAYSTGVTGLTVTAAKANLAGLLPLRHVKLTFAQGKWQLQAVAVPPGSAGSPIIGQFTYNTANTLTTANLTVHNAPLAGMITLSSLNLNYATSSGWTGSANVAQGQSAAGVKLGFNAAGQLISGYLHAANVKAFGVLNLAKFNLDVTSPGTWKLSVEPAPIKGKAATTVAATLGMANGAVTGASIDIHNVAFLSKLTLDNLDLAYNATGNTYDGKVAVTLPGPAGAIVSGKSDFHFANSKFTAGSIEVSGLNVPIGWGAVVHTLGTKVVVGPPLKIGGTVGISFGPKTPAGAALDTTGHLTYNFGTNTYTGDGSISLANITLGNGTFALKPSTSTAGITVHLGEGDGKDGLSVGKIATLHGDVAGTATTKSMTLHGRADFTIAGHKIAGATVHADGAGMAACTDNHNGFTWRWGSNPQPHFNGSCTLSGY